MTPEQEAQAVAEYRAEILANLDVATSVLVLGVSLVVFLLTILVMRAL